MIIVSKLSTSRIIFLNQNKSNAWFQNSNSGPANYTEETLKANTYNNSVVEFAMLFHAPVMKGFERIHFIHPLLQLP